MTNLYQFIQSLNLEIKQRKSGRLYSDCPLCRSKETLLLSEHEDFFFCWGCRNRGNLEKMKKILFG